MQQKHSRLGIASFIVSILITALIFLSIIVAGVMEASSPGGIDETSPAAVILGLVIIGMLLLDLVAFGLGIGAIFQKDRNKLFAILGIIISAVTFLGTISLIIIGNTVAKRSDHRFASSRPTHVQRSVGVRQRSPFVTSRRLRYLANSRTARPARLYWDTTPLRRP